MGGEAGKARRAGKRGYGRKEDAAASAGAPTSFFDAPCGFGATAAACDPSAAAAGSAARSPEAGGAFSTRAAGGGGGASPGWSTPGTSSTLHPASSGGIGASDVPLRAGQRCSVGLSACALEGRPPSPSMPCGRREGGGG